MVEQMEDAEMEALIRMMEEEPPSATQPVQDEFADIDIDLDEDDWRDIMVVAPSYQSNVHEQQDAMDMSG